MSKEKWRDESEIERVQSRVQAAIDACAGKDKVTLDAKTIRDAIEIIKQAKHTEAGHLSGIE